MNFLSNNAGIIFGVIGTILIISLLAAGYVKAPPDAAFIISGFKKNPRTLIGRAGIRIPFLERIDKLSLKQITIDVKTEDFIPTVDFINVQVDAVVKVRVSTDAQKIQLAMMNFLNKNTQEIVADLQDSLQGNMREIIGELSLKDISNNRKAFSEKVQQNAREDMENLGIEIISCNIQSVKDRSGLIEDMGMDNTSKIKKDAAIAKAEAERDIAVAKAQADKEANDAQVKSQTEIAEKNNELAIKKAELKKLSDVKQAEADAAYQIQKEEQRKTIEITTANANIAKQEKEVLLKAKEAEVKERMLEAEVKKKAEAEKFERLQQADAELYEKQRDAEAKKYEKEQEALALKAQAEAEKYAKEQEAEGIRAKGLAEAEAIRAKALAEAEGIEKKAEAMTKMGQASVLEMYFEALPEVVKNAAQPLTNVDKITMYGDGNSSKLVKDIVGSVTQITDGLKESTGVDLQAALSGFLGGRLASGTGSSDEKPQTGKENFQNKSEDY